MTKKNFIALADVIKLQAARAKFPVSGKYVEFTQDQIEHLADFCEAQNSRFDRQRWLDYVAGMVGPSGGKRK